MLFTLAFMDEVPSSHWLLKTLVLLATLAALDQVSILALLATLAF